MIPITFPFPTWQTDLKIFFSNIHIYPPSVPIKYPILLNIVAQIKFLERPVEGKLKLPWLGTLEFPKCNYIKALSIDTIRSSSNVKILIDF